MSNNAAVTVSVTGAVNWHADVTVVETGLAQRDGPFFRLRLFVLGARAESRTRDSVLPLVEGYCQLVFLRAAGLREAENAGQGLILQFIVLIGTASQDFLL